MKQITQTKVPKTIYQEGVFKITATKEVVVDMVTKKAFDVFTFKLYKSDVFSRRYNMAAETNKNMDIEMFYRNAIGTLKKEMLLR